jgi:lipopolysaccharide assembly outer membrane protein LptD (OstA)
LGTYLRAGFAVFALALTGSSLAQVSTSAGPSGGTPSGASASVPARASTDSSKTKSAQSAGMPTAASAGVPARASSDSSKTISADTLVDSPALAAADTSEKKSSELTDTVFYESDFIDYDNENRILHLFSKAQIKYQNITLQADTIVYDVDNNLFQARGKPQLIEGSDTTIGDIMVYNIKTKRGRVSYATARFDDTYFTGNRIVKTEENCLYIENGDFTTCANPEHPHYYFYGEQVKVIPEDKAIGRPVVFNVGDAPIAVLPYFMMPLQRGRRSGWLTPSWGGSVSSGGYVDNLGYYYAPNDYVDMNLSAKVQEFNSFVFNAGSRYALRYKFEGSVSGRYVVDNTLEDESQQWALDYRHNQYLVPDSSTRLSGTGNIISNRSFNRRYSDETNVLENQQLDANMTLSQRFKSINASSNVTWRRNHNLTTDHIVEDIPSFDFNLQNRAVIPYKSGESSKSEASWYNNIYYSYNTKAIMRRDVYGTDSLPGFTRPGMQHNVNLNSSQKILKYFDISPYFNMRASMFYGAIDTAVTRTYNTRDTIIIHNVSDPLKDTRMPDYQEIERGIEDSLIYNQKLGVWDTLYWIKKVSPERRVFVRDTLNDEFNVVRSWDAGVKLSTRLYGLFPVGLFGITNIRHVLSPTVGYSFEPKHELDRTFYNVGINYDKPREKASQRMNLSLANTFQGKRLVGGGNAAGGSVDSSDSASGKKITDTRKEEKFDILSASISTSYDFEADKRKWRDLSLSANTNLNILRLGYSSNFWFYNGSDELTAPIMKDYNIDLTSGSLGASGEFWDGDLLTIDTSWHNDPKSKQNSSGMQSWNLSFSPGYSYRASRAAPQDRFKPTKSFNLSANAGMNLTRALSVQWNGNYDFTSNQFSHNNYTFHYDLECWEMRFTWRPEKINPGFHFVVNVKKIPDIKWEQEETRARNVSLY